MRLSQEPSCAEARDALVLGARDDAEAWRIERHRASCAACAGTSAALAQVRADLSSVPGELDDVRRARMAGRIADALEADARTRLHRRPATPWVRQAFAFGAVALAAAAAVVVVGRGLLPGSRPAGPGGPPVIEPLRVAGPALPRGAAGWVGRSFDRLEIPAGATVRARLGRAARMTIVGPARIEVLEASGDRVEVRLADGALFADYDHRAGGALRVRSPGAVTDIVGTLFAIEARGGRSHVSVAHGRVSVRREGEAQPHAVGDRQRWSSETDAVEAIAPATLARLGEHEGEAEAKPAGEAAVPAPAVVRPAAAPPPAARPPRSKAAPPAPRRLALVEPGVRSAARRAEVAEAPVTPPSGPAAPPPGPGTAPSPVEAPPVAPPARPAPGAAPPARSLGPQAPAAAPPAPTRAVAPVAAPAAAPAPADLYQEAERALAGRDRRRARLVLERLVAAFPADPLVDPARYELAELALRAGDADAAGRHADALAARGRDPELVEAARHLRCRLAFDAGRVEEGVRCLARFRADHPRSARDAEALAQLIAHASARGRCDEVLRLADEYRRAHPRGPFAAEAAQRRARCERR